MKSFNVLARIAYAAYVARYVIATGESRTHPLWAGLSVEHQAAWIEAVKAVTAEVRTIL